MSIGSDIHVANFARHGLRDHYLCRESLWFPHTHIAGLRERARHLVMVPTMPRMCGLISGNAATVDAAPMPTALQ